MNKILIFTFVIGILIFNQSCQKENNNLTNLEKTAIINSAKITVQKVFESSNNLDFVGGLNYYSDEPYAFYTNNGTILTLDDLKKSYNQIGSSVEVLENTINSWNSIVLSKNTVAFTLPISIKIELVGIPEYNGHLVWSGIVQKRNEKWLIIQSHESWLNCIEVLSALTESDNNIQ